MDDRHEEIARCLFRESNDALFIFDPVDHRVVDVNPVALRLTGLDKDVACSLRLPDLFQSDDLIGIDRLAEAYRRTGFFHSREGYRLSRASGDPIPVNLSVSRIHTSPAPLGLVVARDVSERVRSQEVLRDSEDRHRAVVEAARVLMWSVTVEGEIHSLNPVFEPVTGWPVSDWVGRPWAGLVHPDDLPLASRHFDQAVGGEPFTAFEIRVLKADGGYVMVEVLNATRQAIGGRPVISGLALDVTERYRAAEAMKAAESMERAKDAAEAADCSRREFLGNISHEVRTPMTALLGFADVLLGDERVKALPPDLIAHLRTIRQSGAYLLDLMNDILDLTRLEMGKLRVEPTEVAPARLAEDVALTLRPRAEVLGLSLDVRVSPGVPDRVRTDPGRVRQILINLINNAIKFTKEGGIVLRVRAGDGPPGTLRFDVIDTGVGIDPSDVPKLFEPFYTSEQNTKRGSGVGLGLPISRRLAGLLGGKLTVQSTAGEGSTFSLTVVAEPVALPENLADPADSTHPPGPAAPPAAVAKLGGRLLLAEDNEAIRRYVALRLGQAGTDVSLATDGRQAVDLALAAESPFDWILMDVQMPNVDGYEATRSLRDAGYLGPIIALTAYAVTDDQDYALQFGCDDRVAKPIDWNQLIEVLNAHRGKRHQPAG